MDHTLRLLIILLVHGSVNCEPLEEAQKRRSDAYVMYANDFAADYEPVAYAAVSLHAPLPVLHIVSQTPIAPLQSLASTMGNHYARPYSAAAATNTILYARPDRYGGYTYYRKTRYSPKKINKKRNRPVLIRIHKYRVVRDR